MFVAGFLGSPAMNFLRGLLRRDGGWVLDTAGTPLPLDGAPARLEAHAGKALIVGIRPEDLRPVPGPAAVEPIGNEVFLNLDCHGAPLVVRTAAHALPEPGSLLNLAYAPSALHVFDAQSGQRIDA